MITRDQARRLWQWFSTIAVFVSLMGTVTNYIPISITYVVLVPAIPYLLYRAYREMKMSVLHLWLLIAFVYFLISAADFDIGSLISYDFYRRDGSFFPLFIPLFMCSLIEWRITPRRMIGTFVVFGSTLNLFLLMWSLLVPATYPISAWDGLFYSLFESHSAAGGFLLVLSCLTLGCLLSAKTQKTRWLYGLLLLSDLACIWVSESRGSLAGMLVAVIAFIWLFFKDKGAFLHSKLFAKLDIIVLVAVLLVFLIGVGIVTSLLEPMPPYEICTLNNDFYASLPTRLQTQDMTQKLAFMMNYGVIRSGTIIDRLFYLWPRAMDLFIRSPLIGMGTGSFDDLRITGKLSSSISMGTYTFTGMQGFFMRIVNDNVIHSSAHAHNSYLHVMAENGLIGLALLLFLCYQMRRTALAVPDPALRRGLYMSLAGIMCAAFFENRLFAPAQMLPFILVLLISSGIDKNDQNDLDEIRKKLILRTKR